MAAARFWYAEKIRGQLQERRAKHAKNCLNVLGGAGPGLTSRPVGRRPRAVFFGG
jgi:hypothetical protein